MIVRHSIEAPGRTGFVVLEGVNGAGKSTLQRRLAQRLREQGESPLLTREPGGSALGALVRSVVVEGAAGRPSPLAELLLFCADRAEHVDKVIRPALLRKEFVLSDRYYYSTLAFQGYGRGLDRTMIEQLTEIAVRGTEPDLVLLLDLPPEEGLRRIAGANPDRKRDVLEEESQAFQERIRSGFLRIAEESLTPFAVLDATRSPDELLEVAWGWVERICAARGEE